MATETGKVEFSGDSETSRKVRTVARKVRTRRVKGGDATGVAGTNSRKTRAEREGRASSCLPVYEPNDQALLGRHLVVTPWMLLDRLAECQEEAGQIRDTLYQRGLGTERRFGYRVNPLAERVDRLSGEINHLLQLLWRGGLWSDAPVESRTAWDGGEYQVLREPFTNGKPHGKPLPTDTPNWQRELLGLARQEPKEER